MESGQGDLDASTIAKRLRVRKEIQQEPSGSKVDIKPLSTPTGEASTELSSSEREASEEPPVPPIFLRDQSLITNLLDTPAEATDQENPEGSGRNSDSSSEEEANKTVIKSKDCIEDDALNAHAASNDSSTSSSLRVRAEDEARSSIFGDCAGISQLKETERECLERLMDRILVYSEGDSELGLTNLTEHSIV